MKTMEQRISELELVVARQQRQLDELREGLSTEGIVMDGMNDFYKEYYKDQAKKANKGGN